MSTVRYRVPFARVEEEPEPLRERPVPRVARMLALAYHIDALVEADQLKNYGEASRLLEITDARMTQVMDLMLLSPRIQEAILEGRLEIDGKRAQRLTRQVDWQEQECQLFDCRDMASRVRQGYVGE